MYLPYLMILISLSNNYLLYYTQRASYLVTPCTALKNPFHHLLIHFKCPVVSNGIENVRLAVSAKPPNNKCFGFCTKPVDTSVWFRRRGDFYFLAKDNSPLCRANEDPTLPNAICIWIT